MINKYTFSMIIILFKIETNNTLIFYSYIVFQTAKKNIFLENKIICSREIPGLEKLTSKIYVLYVFKMFYECCSRYKLYDIKCRYSLKRF